MHGRGSHHGNQTVQRIGTRQISSDIIPYRRRVGGSAVVAEKPKPLEVTLQRPPYIATDSLPTINPETQFLFWIYAGHAAGVDIGDSFTTYVADRSSAGGSITHRVYAELTMGQGEALEVASTQVVVAQASLAVSSPWTADLTRPVTQRLELARIVSSNGAQTVVGDDGNFSLTDVLVQVDSDGGYIRQVVGMRV